jgi:3-phenylpropionate/trans-cinnamate dioxygenase ferredoxin reductase component
VVALEHAVVVGAGLAGARAAQELRAQGHAGRVTLVGAEAHRPYDRPPLSKDLLLGSADDPTLDLELSDVELRLGVTATGLRPGVVETDAGDLPYDGLVLATGARARHLPGVEGDHVHVLRTVDDARRLRAELQPGARVVVVGAGWIGAEVATAAARAGCRTTVLEAAGCPLAAALGDLGALTAPWYAAAGIELRLGTAVAAVEPGAVVLADGERLVADAVVVGIGAEPATAWLVGSGLAVQGSVVVDEHLAASWPAVVAAGDCAAFPSRRFGTRLHIEHWDDALHAPAVAVATLLGTTAVHDPVPYFWSEQLGHRLQFVGYHRLADEVVHRGEPGSPDGWSVCWLAGGRLDAVLAVDRPRDLAQGRRLVAAAARPDRSRLADPAVPLKAA